MPITKYSTANGYSNIKTAGNGVSNINYALLMNYSRNCLQVRTRLSRKHKDAVSLTCVISIVL